MNNDKIGLIVFAGEAYTQIPITDDYPSVKMFLATTGPDMVSRYGGRNIYYAVIHLTFDVL